jgi:hypothetical protein
VRKAFIRCARWLRNQFDFPVRVPIYLLPGHYVRTADGKRRSASIFLPWDREVEPYIRVATGDYSELREKHGRDNALASFLCSLSHEIIHYPQWIETGESWERGVAPKAKNLVNQYAEITDYP